MRWLSVFAACHFQWFCNGSPCDAEPHVVHPMVGFGHRLVTNGHLGPLADGCKHVFIDVGRDIGMTARKLFENAQYFPSREQSTTPNLNKHWSSIFGSNITAWREEVCLFGYEPDQGQIARLRQIAQRYSSRGWRTTYILAGASGNTSSLPSLHRQGGLVVDGCDQYRQNISALPSTELQIFDLAHFIKTQVDARKLPPDAGSKGGVVVNLDLTQRRAEIEKLLSATRNDGLADGSIMNAVDLFTKEHYLKSKRTPQEIRIEQEWKKFIFPNAEVIDDGEFDGDPFPLLPRFRATADDEVKDPWSTLTVKSDGVFWKEPGFRDKYGSHRGRGNSRHRPHHLGHHDHRGKTAL